MQQSVWNDRIAPLKKLIMKQFIINGLKIVLVDAVDAFHEKGWIVEEHRHPWFEFNYVSEGYIYTKMNGIEFLTEKGCFFLVPPGIFHSHRNRLDQSDDGFCLRWQIESNKAFSKEPEQENFYKKIITTLQHVRAFSVNNQLAVELISDIANASGLMSMQLAFAKLIISIYEFWSEEAIDDKNVNTSEEVIVQQILMYLSEYYSSHITLQSLSNLFNVSYRHLSRIFKKITGVTIIKKLNDIRVNEAKKLLKDTNKTIYEIAVDVGFENEYYFSSIFKQYTYYTPSYFRNEFRN